MRNFDRLNRSKNFAPLDGKDVWAVNCFVVASGFRRQGLMEKLARAGRRVVITVDKHGNTSSASVPMALDHAIRSGKIQPGQLVLMEAFGGGFTWGSALVRF